MLPKIGTTVKALMDLYDSDDKELLVPKNSIGLVDTHFDDDVVAKFETCSVILSPEEYEVVSC